MKTIACLTTLLSALSLSIAAHADLCGKAPAAPELPNGKKATMEDLAGASQAVKQFIADADLFLDCRDQLVASPEFTEMDEGQQDGIRDENKKLLEKRNTIGEKFNKEVRAYKKANPN